MATVEMEVSDGSENVNENLLLDQSMDEERSGSGTSDSEDGSEEEEVDEGKINELREQISENPYVYDSHLELIKLFRKGGDLVKLREARENMSRIFPLTPELWIEWLTDESKLASSEEEKKALVDLFERAVKDYTSVPVWLEYVQFSIGNMGMKDGVNQVRNIFERALTACGLHVSQGALIWEAYREFELVILNTIQPPPGSVASPEQQEEIKQQRNRVMTLFKRQLSVPLYDMERTLEEFKEWNEDEEYSIMVEQLYEKSFSKLSKLQQFEESLISSAPPHLEEYYRYIEFEEKQADPCRVQCVYERAIAENCLVPELWQKYIKYLDAKLKIGTVIIPVHERAIRNCPWSVTLWLNYILVMERHCQPHESVNGIVDHALQAGFTQGEEVQQIWMAFLDYLRRRVKWNEDNKEGLQELRDTFQRAIDHLRLYFGTQGDYTIEIFKYWALIEAKMCANLPQARELWKEILKGGHGAEAQIWLEYFNFERTFGDVNTCRSVLRQGLNSASDWPEAVGEALINFERQEGTLESLDESRERYEKHMVRVKERRQKKAEKEEMQQKLIEEQKLAKAEKKKAEKRAAKAASKMKHIEKESLKRKFQESDSSETENVVRKAVKLDAEGFKIPPVPGMKNQAKGPPKPEESDLMESESAKQNLEEKETEKSRLHGETVEHDTSKDPRTVFISNLSYSLEEDMIRELFNEIGEITDLRLVRDYKGRSKGYCYLEFATKELAEEALKKDRMPIDGRPAFVSPCEDRKKSASRKSFKFGTGLEKNKLFIKGLPFSVTEDDLREMFKVFGPLKDVRLVTYRNGNSKGLAYVEYETESAASTAVVKTDGTQLGEHTITVAISNPPERKQRKPEGGGKTVTVFQNVLGGGTTAAMGPRGRGRTQLSMLPRALQQNLRKNQENGTANGTSTNGTAAAVEEPKMSNEDFRRLLRRN